MNNAYYNLLDEGVLRAHEKTVEFFHQTFFEYAAARALIEKDEQEQLEYLLNNTTLLENRAIIQQVILYAKGKKKDEIAHRFLEKLSETNLYTKMFAIDLLKHIENITEKEVEIYQSLNFVARMAAAGTLPRLVEVNPEVAIGLIEILSKDGRLALPEGETFRLDKELVVRLNMQYSLSEALLKLAELYPQKVRPLVEKLKAVESLDIQKAIAEIARKGLLR